MLKVLHTGDVHLDSPFSSLDPHRAEIRRLELRAAFTSMMTYARTENVDLVLIAGDLFDVEYVTRETLSLIKSEISKLKCPVVISPGNHDCASESSIWRRNIFPPNAYIFTDSELASFDFPEINTTVYGWAFTSPRLDYAPLAGAMPEKTDRINILCAHCDLTSPVSSSCPVSVSEIERCGFDYAALGHIHNPGSYPDGIAYCGCLEGRSFDETGPKGALIVNISDSPDVQRLRINKIRFSKRRYENETLQVDGAFSNTELSERIEQFISQRRFSDDTILRLTLKGSVDPSFVINIPNLEKSEKRLFAIKINDETVPEWNADMLKNDPSVKGEFYRLLEPKLFSGDPAERSCAAAALRYGLAALTGESVTDGWTEI